jgi:hypothetical protein
MVGSYARVCHCGDVSGELVSSGDGIISTHEAARPWVVRILVAGVTRIKALSVPAEHVLHGEKGCRPLQRMVASNPRPGG